MLKKLLTIFKLLFVVILLLCACQQKPDQKNEEDRTSPETKIHEAPEDAESTSENGFEMRLWKKGIDFHASGNEPSWSLDMDFEQLFRFNTIAGAEITTPPAFGEKAQDADLKRYLAESTSGTLIISIREEKCADSMADEQFDFSVRVQVKPGAEDDYTEYLGCGFYVPDFGIHDIWVLDSLNGNSLKSKKNTSIRFEFFVREGKILGATGCGEFSGSFAFVGPDEIQFDDFKIFNTACMNAESENILAKRMFGKRLKYAKVNRKLKLEGYDGTELVLKKVD